jgi:cytidine deaminase
MSTSIKSTSTNKIENMLKVAIGTADFSNVDTNKAICASALGSSGKIYGGPCFVSIPQDYCAERVVLLKALSEGETKIDSILITWLDHDKKIDGPCGICLNALWQLSNNENLEIIIYSPKKDITIRNIRDFYKYPYSQKI